MQFRTASMSAMLAITKHGVSVGIIAPCLVNFIMADMEAVQNCIPRQLSCTKNRSSYGANVVSDLPDVYHVGNY